MDSALFSFLQTLITGALGLADQVFSGIPNAYDFILWAFFVYLVMNLIVLPIRGIGASDRALAKEVRSGRAESTAAVIEGRRQSKALRQESYQRYHIRNSYEHGPRRRSGRF